MSHVEKTYQTSCIPSDTKLVNAAWHVSCGIHSQIVGALKFVQSGPPRHPENPSSTACVKDSFTHTKSLRSPVSLKSAVKVKTDSNLWRTVMLDLDFLHATGILIKCLGRRTESKTSCFAFKHLNSRTNIGKKPLESRTKKQETQETMRVFFCPPKQRADCDNIQWQEPASHVRRPVVFVNVSFICNPCPSGVVSSTLGCYSISVKRRMSITLWNFIWLKIRDW